MKHLLALGLQYGPDLDYYNGRAYAIEDVPGDDTCFSVFEAYPIDLFEEGSVVNILTSLVGNVFGLALRAFRLEDILPCCLRYDM